MTEEKITKNSRKEKLQNSYPEDYFRIAQINFTLSEADKNILLSVEKEEQKTGRKIGKEVTEEKRKYIYNYILESIKVSSFITESGINTICLKRRISLNKLNSLQKTFSSIRFSGLNQLRTHFFHPEKQGYFFVCVLVPQTAKYRFYFKA